MPGTVIGKSLNLGYAGKVARNNYARITSRMVKSILDGSNNETLKVVPFGSAVVVNTDNTYSKFGDTGSGVAAATLANFGGFAVAEVKQTLGAYGYGTQNNDGSYSPSQPMDVLQEGVITVPCKDGTPVANGKVYICTVAGGAIAVGDLVCSTTPTGGGTAIELTNVRWHTGKVDANQIAEIIVMSQINA